MVATSLCQSDVSAWSGKYPHVKFPTILGHEGAGIVESVGPNVTTLKVGDFVIPSLQGECQKLDCSVCQREDSNVCISKTEAESHGTMSDGTTRFRSKDGKPIYHFMNTSLFTEYTVVKEINVAKITKAADLKTACLLSCGAGQSED